MAWTEPRTWVVGEIVTADLMNTHIRNNERYLRGLDGVVTIDSGLIIDNTGGDEYLKLPLLSTAETGTVLDAEGKIAHDEATHRIKLHDGTAVRSLVSTADIDDTPANGATTDPISSNWAYDFQQALTTAGDLPYATAAGVWSRLGVGTALQWLRTNAGQTAPEWASQPSGIAINVGTYTGNNAENRAIAHGLGTTPKVVLITISTGGPQFIIISGNAAIIYGSNAADGAYAVTAMDATNFYVGDAASYDNSANANAVVYYWVAAG